MLFIAGCNQLEQDAIYENLLTGERIKLDHVDACSVSEVNKTRISLIEQRYGPQYLKETESINARFAPVIDSLSLAYEGGAKIFIDDPAYKRYSEALEVVANKHDTFIDSSLVDKWENTHQQYWQILLAIDEQKPDSTDQCGFVLQWYEYIDAVESVDIYTASSLAVDWKRLN